MSEAIDTRYAIDIRNEMLRMTAFGFIGTGHMGSMLVRKFIETGAISANEITVSNRTREKADQLAANLGVGCKDNRDVVRLSDVVFLCIRPREVRDVLMELHDLLTPEKLLVSVAGDVSLKNLYSQCSARVARAFPSMASESLMGVTLLALGDNVTETDKTTIMSIFGALGHPVEVKEDHFEVLADLTSCGPGYIAALMQEFALAASWRGIPRNVTEELVKETLAGTARLMESENFGDLIACVATKGGITEEGVKVIREDAPQMFNRLFQATKEKHNAVKKLIADQSMKEIHS